MTPTPSTPQPNTLETPRTDTAEFYAWSDGDNSKRAVTSSNFARQLERELNAANVQLERTTWSDAQFKNELLMNQIKELKEQLSAAVVERDELRMQIQFNEVSYANRDKVIAELQTNILGLREAVNGMLENYIELKRISLIMAKSDAPGWVGQAMTVDDDIHVQRVRKALSASPPDFAKEWVKRSVLEKCVEALNRDDGTNHSAWWYRLKQEALTLARAELAKQ